MAARLDHHAAEGTTGRIARRIGRTLPLFHGGGPVGAAELLDRYEDLLDEFVAAIEVVVAAGTDPLADVCELAVLGEQVGLPAGLRPSASGR